MPCGIEKVGNYKFSFSDYSIELDNIGVGELSHDGCLLEELDLVSLTSSFFECLHGYLNLLPSFSGQPFSPVN